MVKPIELSDKIERLLDELNSKGETIYDFIGMSKNKNITLKIKRNFNNFTHFHIL